MSTEAPLKRESHTGWIIGVGLLFLLAVGIPLALKFYTANEFIVELDGDPGGKILWEFKSDIKTQTGVTNLPVKLIFHARNVEFTAQRTNYTGFLKLAPLRDGGSIGVVQIAGPTGGVRFWYDVGRSSGICGTP